MPIKYFSMTLSNTKPKTNLIIHPSLHPSSIDPMTTKPIDPMNSKSANPMNSK